jgi:hypothetical protein
MEGWLTNPGQYNNQVPNYLPIGEMIRVYQPIADKNRKFTGCIMSCLFYRRRVDSREDEKSEAAN